MTDAVLLRADEAMRPMTEQEKRVVWAASPAPCSNGTISSSMAR